MINDLTALTANIHPDGSYWLIPISITKCCLSPFNVRGPIVLNLNLLFK